MGIMLIKAKLHLVAAVKKIFYRLVYGKGISFGKNTTFRKNFSLYIEKNARIELGNDCFFNNGCSLNCLEKIKIGDRCIFGEGVKIYDQNHCFKDISRPIKEQGFSSAPVEIGNDCWICSNVTILKGVKIGNHCVIGAGCLIYKDIPDNTIVKHKTGLVLSQRNIAEGN